MIGIHDLPLFLVSGLLLNQTPGADSLYVVTRGAAQGTRAGAVAALGIGAGCLAHVLAAARVGRAGIGRRASAWLSRGAGGLFVLLGVRLAFADRN